MMGTSAYTPTPSDYDLYEAVVEYDHPVVALIEADGDVDSIMNDPNLRNSIKLVAAIWNRSETAILKRIEALLTYHLEDYEVQLT